MRNRLIITISDVKGTKSYNLHQFVKKDELLRSIKNSLRKDGALYLREFQTNLLPCLYNDDVNCKERITEDKMKAILKENGFRLEKELKIQDIILLKYVLNDL